MAQARRPLPVIPIVAVISRYRWARTWGLEQLQSRLGPAVTTSDPQPFTASGYYQASMGGDLQKQFVSFAPVDSPEQLAVWKTWTNQLEATLAERAGVLAADDDDSPPFAGEPRPLNLDCGYVTEAKLVLATTKDRDHRIYLSQGIYAEVTLSYKQRRWESHRWSYPDYQTPLALEFVESCRMQLRDYLTSWRQQNTREG